MSAQFALPNGFYEGVHFVFFARGQKLDAAIAQIPHGAGDIESLRYLPDGITKTNTLHVSVVEDLYRGDHATRRLIRHSAGGNRRARILLLRLGRQSRQIGIRQLFWRRDKARIVRVEIELLTGGAIGLRLR